MDYKVNGGYNGEPWTEIGTSSPPKSTNGFAVIRLERIGKRVKMFINDKLIREHDVQGNIAGIAIGTSGHLHFSFGMVGFEALSISSNNNLQQVVETPVVQTKPFGTVYSDSAYTSQATKTTTSATVNWKPKNVLSNGVILEVGELLSAVYSGSASYTIQILKNDKEVYKGIITGKYPWTTLLKPNITYVSTDGIKFVISSSSSFYVTGQNIAWFESSTGNDIYMTVKYQEMR
jgi:hypothetical protein